MNINLTPIFQAVIVLIATLITYKLVPWIKSKTTAQQQANLLAIVKTLVFAAEQIYGANSGAEKMQYVKERLLEKGYDVDIPTIEGAVAQYINFVPVHLELEHENDDDAD